MAVLAPPQPSPPFTYGAFIALLNRLPRPNVRFADDLEAIQAEQQPARMPDWPD